MDIDEPHESQEELLIADSPVSDSPQMSSGFRDDDSGRASCCDPDLSDHDQTDLHHPAASGHDGDGFHPLSRAHSGSPQPVPPCPQDSAWPNSLYSQVSDVTQRGEVVLSPEEQEIANSCCHNKAVEDNENNKRKELQWLALTSDTRGYTSELTANVMSAHHSKPNPPVTDQSPFTEPQNLSFETDCFSLFPILAKPPSPEYTMVEGVDWKNSLLLKPNTQTSPQTTAVKTFPSPEGYFTAEFLDNISG